MRLNCLRTRVRRACRKMYEALEAYWEELNREGCFADFVASVERAADIEDERLRAAWVAAVSVEAAWANVETNSSRTVAARSVEAARANEETNSNGMAALGDLLEALDAWEQHLSYAWYCVGLMRGPARGVNTHGSFEETAQFSSQGRPRRQTHGAGILLEPPKADGPNEDRRRREDIGSEIGPTTTPDHS